MCIINLRKYLAVDLFGFIVQSPEDTLISASHTTANWTLKVFAEIGQIRQWSDYSEACRAVGIVKDHVFQIGRWFSRTVHAGERQEEYLVTTETFQTGHQRFGSCVRRCHVQFVGLQGGTYATVVGYVFPLRIHSVHLSIIALLVIQLMINLKARLICMSYILYRKFFTQYGVVGVLFDDTLGPG